MTAFLVGSLVALVVLGLRQVVRRRRAALARLQLLSDAPTPSYGHDPDNLDGRLPRDF